MVDNQHNWFKTAPDKGVIRTLFDFSTMLYIGEKEKIWHKLKFSQENKTAPCGWSRAVFKTLSTATPIPRSIGMGMTPGLEGRVASLLPPHTGFRNLHHLAG
jgi:hypothetical protein